MESDGPAHSLPRELSLLAGLAVRLVLTRSSGDHERTIGNLDVGGVKFATIERPWIEHEHGPGGANRQSCVPKGLYTVRPHHTKNFPNTYAIVNPDLGVWYQPGDIPKNLQYGRCAILMHVGNRVKDVIGCVAVGMEHGTLWGEPAVLRSTLAMRQLDALLKRQIHSLEIV